MGNKDSKKEFSHNSTTKKSQRTSRRSRRARSEDEMTQNTLLIWLDSEIDEGNDDCQDSLNKLSQVVKDIKTFTESDPCVKYVERMTEKKILMVISGSLGRNTVPRIHNLPQVNTILIYCGDRSRNESWSKQHSKIKDIVTEMTPLCEALRKAMKSSDGSKRVSQTREASNRSATPPRVEDPPTPNKKQKDRKDPIKKSDPSISKMKTSLHKIITVKAPAGHKSSMSVNEDNDIPISFVTLTKNASSKKLDQLDPLYMYTQILKEILLSINFDQRHFIEFVDYCQKEYRDDSEELENVELFRKHYDARLSIYWYTYECFLYRMVNLSLRTMDVDIMIKVGFFIGDLHRQLEQLHLKQFGKDYSGKSFTVYRGQGLAKSDFEKVQTKRGLLSFNNFLSTSRDAEASLDFARSRPNQHDTIRILFVMEIDPSKTTTPFADISKHSFFERENEVLFAMHTVFRVGSVTLLDENDHLYRVDLTLTSDDDKDLSALAQRIREETCPDGEGWERLGELLLKIGQYAKAEQVYRNILQQKTTDSEKATVYHQLAWAMYNQGQHEEAMALYDKSLEVKKKMYPANHPQLGAAYNNIGETYRSMGQHSKALFHFEKAVEIFEEIFPPTDLTLAKTYSNIGSLYCNMDEYSKALPYFKKSLDIFQQALLPNHPHLAACYNNIGGVYECMDNYSKACSFYEKATDIGRQALPPNHPHLKIYEKNLQNAKENASSS